MRANQLHSWTLSSIKNVLEFTHVSFYDGKCVIGLRPPELNFFREEMWDTSVSNPRVFAEFFGLKDYPSNFKATDFVSNSLLKEPTLILRNNTLGFTCPVRGNTKDLEFSIDKAFFKVNKFEIERGLQKDWKQLLELHRIKLQDDRILVDRLFIVTGFKFLASNKLKNLVDDFVAGLSPLFSSLSKARRDRDLSSMKATELMRTDSVQSSHPHDRRDNHFFPSEVAMEHCAHNNHKQYSAVIVIRKPQINLYDDCTETQVLFGSNGDSVFLVYKEYLEYDLFQQDPRVNFDFHFHMLELYTGELTSPKSSGLPQALFLGGANRSARAVQSAAAQRQRLPQRDSQGQPERDPQLRLLPVPLPLLPPQRVPVELRQANRPGRLGDRSA